jgi:hypothetical protein
MPPGYADVHSSNVSHSGTSYPVQGPAGAAGIGESLKKMGAALGDGSPWEFTIPEERAHGVAAAVVLDPVLARELLERLQWEILDVRSGL